MFSRRQSGMKCRFQRLACLLMLEWALLEFPVSANGVASHSKSNNREPGGQLTLLVSRSKGRYLLDTPFVANSVLLRKSVASSMDLVPAPAPTLFPSEPPVTIPFSPPPETLTVPMGNCSINFTEIQSSFFQTTYDCVDPFAPYVGVAICCPQFSSLLRIMQGQHISVTGALGLNHTEAEYCFSETLDALDHYGTNNTIASLCSVHPENLTVGSCPVTTMTNFELLVNTSLLLQACQDLQPLKECTSKTCQYAVGNASLDLAQGLSGAVSDCEPVVLSWLASQSTTQQANSILRFLSSCTINQVCPLVIKDTEVVAVACNSSALSSISCCEALNQYLQTELQTQMLITNQQAFKCATNLAVLLQKQGVSIDLYTLCGIDLRDFSLQARGKEGCLLPSQPTEINMTTGIPTFICDLNDNILAQWPNQTEGPSGELSRSLSLHIGSGLRIIGSVFIVMFLSRSVL